MQTFLPYESFQDSAHILDDRRIWKQFLEADQLYSSIVCKTDFYKNHPARLMWEGHSNWLRYYQWCILQEWIKRRSFENFHLAITDFITSPETKPKWLGNKDFHLSHKSNLLRKDRSYYGAFWPEVPDNLPYFWPSKELDNPIKV